MLGSGSVVARNVIMQNVCESGVGGSCQPCIFSDHLIRPSDGTLRTRLKDVREAGEDVPGIRVARDGARGLHVPHDVVAEGLRQLPVAQKLLHALHLRARAPSPPGPAASLTSFLCAFGLLAIESARRLCAAEL